MLYECYKCENLVDEDNGIIIHKHGILFTPSHIFICKNCLGKKGREKFEKVRKK